MIENKYKKLGINTILVFAGSVGSKLLSFVMLPFYSKWFTEEEFGSIDYLGVSVNLVTIIISFSIADSIFRFPKDQTQSIQASYFSSGLIFLVLGYLILSFFWLFNIDYVFNESLFSQYKTCVSLLIVAITLQLFLQQFCRSIDKMTVYVLSGLIITFFTILLSFLFIPQFGIIAFFYSQVVAFLISSTYIFFHAKIWTYLSISSISKVRLKEMLSYSIPLIPNGIMWWILSSSNRFFLESYIGLAAVGIFGMANRFSSLVSTTFNIFFTSWQVSVLDEFNKKGYKEYYNKILSNFFVILSFIVIFLSACSYWLVYVFIDLKFLESWVYIPCLSFGVLLLLLSSFIATNFLALKKTKIILYSSLGAALISILLNYLLIPLLGIWGAIISICIANFVLVFTRIICSWKFVKINNLSRYIYSTILLLISVIIISSVSIIYLNLFTNIIIILLFAYVNRSTLLIYMTFFKLKIKSLKK